MELPHTLKKRNLREKKEKLEEACFPSGGAACPAENSAFGFPTPCFDKDWTNYDIEA